MQAPEKKKSSRLHPYLKNDGTRMVPMVSLYVVDVTDQKDSTSRISSTRPQKVLSADKQNTKTFAVAASEPSKDETQIYELESKPKPKAPTKKMKSRDDCVLLVDETSLYTKGLSYPYEKKTALECEGCSDQLSNTYAQYRERGVMFVAYFTKLTALKQAMMSLPRSSGSDEKMAIIFSHPRVEGHKPGQVFPSKRLDIKVSPLTSQPGVFMYPFNETNLNSTSYAFVCSDHCFIADTFVNRSLTVVFRKQVHDQIMNCDPGYGLIMFRLSGGEQCLHLEFCRSDGRMAVPMYVGLKLLEVHQNVECMIQMPVMSDEYTQWIYIELETKYLDGLLHDSYSATSFASKKGKPDAQANDSTTNSGADRALVFRVYYNQSERRGRLVAQNCSLQAGAGESETFFTDLIPKQKEGIMMNMDPGKRAFFVMDSSGLGSGSTQLLGDEALFLDSSEPTKKAPFRPRLDGYVQMGFCATNRALFCKAMGNGFPRRKDMSPLTEKRPILMIPHRYEQNSEAPNFICGNGMLVLVQTVGLDEAPKAFEVIKAMAEMELDDETYTMIPTPTDIPGLASYISYDGATDKSFLF